LGLYKFTENKNNHLTHADETFPFRFKYTIKSLGLELFICLVETGNPHCVIIFENQNIHDLDIKPIALNIQ
jgi:diaminopimelate epimerase